MFDFFKKRKTEPPRRSRFLRAFNAAETSRLLRPWIWDGGFSNTEIAASLSEIRSRSRDMAKNSEHYVRWLDLFVANVVGDGFKFKALPSKSDTDPKVDAKAADFLNYHWWKWGTNPALSDVTGRKSFAAICRLCAENWARDGEAFVLIDRADGISLDDCEKVTRLIDPILDDADPIADSYFLEVSSAGLERSLKTPEQFSLSIGKQVAVSLYQPKNGEKELTGTLNAFEDGAILIGDVRLEKGEYAAVKTLDTTL